MTEARWSCWMRRESRLRVWCQWHRSSNAHPGEANKSRCPTPTNALSVCACGAACALGIRQRTETRPLRSRAPRASSSAPQSTEEDAGRPGPATGCQSRPVLPCGRIAHLEFSGGRPSQDSLRCGWSAHCRGMNRLVAVATGRVVHSIARVALRACSINRPRGQTHRYRHDRNLGRSAAKVTGPFRRRAQSSGGTCQVRSGGPGKCKA